MKNKKKITKYIALVLIISLCNFSAVAAKTPPPSLTPVTMLDYLDADTIESLTSEQRQVIEAFEVGEVVKDRSYYLLTETESGQLEATEVSETYFYNEVIKVPDATSHEDAMSQYAARKKETLSTQRSTRMSIADSNFENGSFYVLTTTMYHSADSTNYDYMVRNEIECDPWLSNHYTLVNCITTGANLSVIDDLYIARETYDMVMPDNTYTEVSGDLDLYLTQAQGYACATSLFPYNIAINHYCQLLIYVHPNVSNLTIADAYGWASHRSMSYIPSNLSIGIGYAGASISISPSPSNWVTVGNHMQDER